MQEHEKTKPTPEKISEFQRAINTLLFFGEEDVLEGNEGKEELHRWLDDLFLAYLLDPSVDRDEISEHFYFYSAISKIIRLAKKSLPPKIVQP